MLKLLESKSESNPNSSKCGGFVKCFGDYIDWSNLVDWFCEDENNFALKPVEYFIV